MSSEGTNRSDAVTVTWSANDRKRRFVFEPRSDGRYDRVEEVFTTGGYWREVGTEAVDTVAVENATETV